MELAPGEIGVWLNPSGENLTLSDEEGTLSEAEQQLLLAWTALESGERTLLLPVSATRAIQDLVERYGARAEYIAGEPALWMNELVNRQPLQFILNFDGIQAALAILSMLVESDLSLAQWRQSMPQVYRRTRAVPITPSQTGRILHAFAEKESDVELGGGVRFNRGDGWAWICPDESKPEFRIVTESRSAEFARELCDFCEQELARLSTKE